MDWVAYREPIRLKDLLYLSVTPGNGHISIWVGLLLITIDYWGHRNLGTRLVSCDWNPD